MLHAEPAGEQAQRRSRLQTFSPALGIAVQAVSARWHPEGLNPLWRNIDKHGEHLLLLLRPLDLLRLC